MMHGTITIPLGRKAVYGTLTVDTTRFAPHVHEHIYEYGLRQVLNDAIADKTDEDGRALPAEQIVAKAQTRLDHFYAGTLRTRNAAEPVDPVEAELHRIARERIHATYTAAGLYRALPKGAKNRLLAVANMRRHERGLDALASERDVLRVYLETAPDAARLRKEAERNVRERGNVDLDAIGV